jgi:hypothetical protein
MAAIVEGPAKEQGRISASRSPDSIRLVVAGGVGTKATYIPTWHGGTSAITEEVEW